MFARSRPRNMCEYIVGRRLSPRGRVRVVTPSPPDPPPPPAVATPELAPPPPVPANIAPCSCCPHRRRSRSRSRSPRRVVTFHVTDFDTSSDESSGEDSDDDSPPPLKSALNIPDKPHTEEPKTLSLHWEECECATCVKLVLGAVKEENIKKKQASADKMYCPLTFDTERAHSLLRFS